MPEAITVCLVDDHAVVRQGVRAFLAAQPDINVIGEAGTGAEAMHLVTAYAPMVVLVDLVMPEMDGVEITRRIKQIRPSTQVIVLTSFLTDEHLFPALRAGALSYLLKDAGAEEIAAAIRKAAHNEAVLHPRIAARLAQEMRGGRKPTINPFTELSDRELDVLRLIAEGLSNAQIAERLVIGEGTVKTHVTNLLGKLHLVDRTQAAIFAWREGIVRQPPARGNA
ncbi:MAG TPA: response regulator transcription factor [Ktedonobacterales bacterium]|nr:response regulator transcription factor [Ktedonobacterales bacterium]